MKPTQQLHDLGQSLWIDNITRTMLDDGTLAGYIDELSVTGLTSNPTIFDKAIGGGDAYDDQIAELTEQGLEGEELFFELALTDLRRAAELFKPVHERTDDRRPGLARGLAAARRRRRGDDQAGGRALLRAPRRTSSSRSPAPRPAARRSRRRSSPGSRSTSPCCSRPSSTSPPPTRTCAGSSAGSRPASNPDVASVASLFLSRWDVAVADEVPDELRNRLGIAIGKHAYAAYRELLDSDRAMRLRNEGAKAQRLLWASTGTKDPNASDTLYIEGLAAPFTVNTMPEKTLLAFADHGTVGEPLPRDGGDAERDAGGVQRRRDRPRRARRPAPGGGQGVVQQVLERAAGSLESKR